LANALQSALEEKLPILRLIPTNKLKKLNMPSSAVAQDALFTYKWCLGDRVLLVARNLNWNMVEDIPNRVMAFEEAQSDWNNVRFGREEAMTIWMAISPEGYELRDDLLHEYNYAYYGFPEFHTRVDAVAEGTGDADMIQDLNDLVVIGRENPDPLTDTAFDFTLLDQAAELCGKLGHLRAEASVDKSAYREQKLIRDQAYTHLMEAISEIRRCGQFVFRKDEDRRRGYASQYKHSKRSSKETEPEVTNELSELLEADTDNSETKSA
jgi:hypothetical protein